jgi:hypothetical protein
MPKATQQDTPPRRSFLGHLIGAAAGTSIVYGCTDLSATSSDSRALPATGSAGLDDGNPDAELIAMCERHPALIDAANAETIDDGPAWQAYAASRDAISEAQPRALAGMRAKALAAKAEARMPDGSEHPAGSLAENWSWDLVNDLLRLTGGAA